MSTLILMYMSAKHQKRLIFLDKPGIALISYKFIRNNRMLISSSTKRRLGRILLDVIDDLAVIGVHSDDTIACGRYRGHLR